MEHLDERKTKILKAIIQTYLETGEPVGSRTISKYTDLNLSSATIRNEMSDLEELGYIVQPHTSAGRIPSDKGYRFYVDNLMEEKDREVSEMKDFVIERTEKMEQVLKQVVKLLATNTNYATMITAPQYQQGKLKFKPFTLMAEIGMRCDLYMPFFKLIPELKFCFGLGNVLKKNRPDLIDPTQRIFTESVDRATVSMVVLTLYFE